MDYTIVLSEIIKEHEDVTLSIDFMYVNNINFVVSTYWGIRFIMAEYVNDRSKGKLMVSIKIIMNIYYNCTFKVATLLMDTEFDPIRYDIGVTEGTKLNTESNKEHVPDIERTIRALK